METYRQHINEIVLTELKKAAEQHELIFIEQLCDYIANKYDLDICLIRAKVKLLYPSLGLSKRRLNKSIKAFYNLDNVKGYPSVLTK